MNQLNTPWILAGALIYSALLGAALASAQPPQGKVACQLQACQSSEGPCLSAPPSGFSLERIESEIEPFFDADGDPIRLAGIPNTSPPLEIILHQTGDSAYGEFDIPNQSTLEFWHLSSVPKNLRALDGMTLTLKRYRTHEGKSLIPTLLDLIDTLSGRESHDTIVYLCESTD